MTNWAYNCYAIEGPKETLERIYEAILHHPVEKDSDESWEGNILKALGIEWKRKQPDGSGLYMRGFIKETPWWQDDEHTVLRFDATEAWGATDFNEALEAGLPDVKAYYSVEEEGEEIYATNDKEGKYFPDRFYVDTAVNNDYDSEYFKTEDAMWQWLSKKVPELISREAVEKWNEKHEELCDEDENFINIHKISIV